MCNIYFDLFLEFSLRSDGVVVVFGREKARTQPKDNEQALPPVWEARHLRVEERASCAHLR